MNIYVCIYIKFIYSGAQSQEVSFYHYLFSVLHFPHYLEKMDHCFKNDRETRVARRRGTTWQALDFFLPGADLHTCRRKGESEHTTVCVKNQCAGLNQGAKKREV